MSSTTEPPPHRCSRILTQAGFAHAFFERGGGDSEGVFSSLNFTSASGDSPEHVEQNLRRAGTALKTDPKKIYFLSQVHGTSSLLVDGREDTATVLQTEGDLVLTCTNDVAAAIRTADCVPILLACPDTGWVAACHSGWQGCEKNVAGIGVKKLLTASTAQASPSRLLAAIGPHISKASFEVSEDVAQRLQTASPDPDIVDRSGKKPHVDLRKMVRAQLLAEGLRRENIDDVPGCTVLEKNKFFSYRRDGNPSGRMLSAIRGGLGNIESRN